MFRRKSSESLTGGKSPGGTSQPGVLKNGPVSPTGKMPAGTGSLSPARSSPARSPPASSGISITFSSSPPKGNRLARSLSGSMAVDDRRKTVNAMLKKVKDDESQENDHKEGLKILRSAGAGHSTPAWAVQHGGEPAPLEIAQYGAYLGLKYPEDASFVWIAEQAILAPLPEGWSEHVAPNGRIYYYDEHTDTSQVEHPADRLFRDMIRELREKRREKQERQRAIEQAKREEIANQVVASLRAGPSSPKDAVDPAAAAAAAGQACTPDEVRDFAAYLGIDEAREPHLLWLARDTLVAGLPQPWTEHEDAHGPYYWNPSLGTTTRTHPLDAPTRGKIRRVRAALARGRPRPGDEDYARVARYLAASPALDLLMPGPSGRAELVWYDFFRDRPLEGPPDGPRRLRAAAVVTAACRALLVRRMAGPQLRARRRARMDGLLPSLSFLDAGLDTAPTGDRVVPIFLPLPGPPSPTAAETRHWAHKLLNDFKTSAQIT